ncbi:MAG: YncE family protein [Verrucomicrobia bacterium]|nr:YncE family protein [Verrucomicrobiota bacterium]
MKQFVPLIVALALAHSVRGQWVISGNENKIDLLSGTPAVLQNTKPDSLTILDFSKTPPGVEHLADIPNSVIGPPSNIAITPDARLALIANSLKLDSTAPAQWVPESFVHVLDLTTKPPKIIGRVSTGLQPSGISITPNGKLALIANRASGSISVLRILGKEVTRIGDVEICEPALSISDVAISPDGKLALASIQKGGYLAELQIDGEHISATGRKLSVYGQPYRCVITPDGQLGLTAGQGFGSGTDMDALSVIDLTTSPIRATDHIPIGSSPESIEISPDGNLLAAVVMNQSNLPPGDPSLNQHGGLVILTRRGNTFQKTQEIPIGRIPEGVAFTGDGRFLILQCHPARELWVFSVANGSVQDTGQRIAVPGMPSSLRAAR